MKKYSPSNSRISIVAAQQPGTRFYRIPLEFAIEVLKDDNIILINRLSEDGWNALDLKTNFYGSTVEGDDFYLCDTDGKDIEIQGELIDPESVIDEMGLDAIQPYVAEATPEIVHRNISTYELGPVDMDDVAYKLLEEGYSFQKIVDAAEDASLLRNEYY